METWECPECGETNRSEVILCACGYMDDGGVHKDETFATPTNTVRQKTGGASPKKRSSLGQSMIGIFSKHRSSIFESWFELSTWKNGYSRWTLLLVFGIFFLRGTTDGLWFLAYAAVATASRWESHKRHGTAFIFGKKQGQTIWEYGVNRTITAILAPILLKYDPVKFSHVALQVPLIMIYALHLYVGTICLFDAINAEYAAKILTIVNQPAANLLPYWPSYHDTAEKLIAHGYENRIPLVSHVYIVCAISCIGYLFYCLLCLFEKESQSLDDHYDLRREELKTLRLPGFNTIFDRIIDRFFKWRPGFLFMHFLGACCLLFFIYFACELPLHFPGESHPRHGRYVWMYSFAYTDNIGLFTPIYLLQPAVTMLYAGFIGLLEPFYRSGLYLARLLKK